MLSNRINTVNDFQKQTIFLFSVYFVDRFV